MNQIEDDHSGGQEETRGSRLCCVIWLLSVVMVIMGQFATLIKNYHIVQFLWKHAIY